MIIPTQQETRKQNGESTMLYAGAIKTYYAMLWFGCFFHMIPYRWDSKAKQIRPATKKGLFVYRLHNTYIVLMGGFALSRLLYSFIIGTAKGNLMETILNSIWGGAYAFTMIMYIQFELLREELMVYTNTLLLQLQGNPPRKDDDKETVKSRKSWSRQVNIALWLFFVNPSAHALAVPAAPCSPHFMSSVYYDCSDPSQVPRIFTLERIPFFMKEYYGITVILYTWSFNWAIIFMGMAWVIKELRAMMRMPDQEDRKVLGHYRLASLCMKELNHSVYYYLTAFPTILFLVLALLVFGCIRLWHLDFRANLVFPVCGARCAFEVLSPLTIAGQANSLSKEIKFGWKKWRGDKYAERFKRSCPPIKCEAGSMYTFEHSIVPVSIDNLYSLIFNLMIGFK